MTTKVNINQSAINDIYQKLSAALYQEGQGLITSSQPLVPVDTGALRSSGFVNTPVTSGDKISVKLGYGGPATKVNPKTGEATTDYAVKVHEDLQMHHTVGEAKYLEKPARQLQPKLEGNIKRRLGI